MSKRGCRYYSIGQASLSFQSFLQSSHMLRSIHTRARGQTDRQTGETNRQTPEQACKLTQRQTRRQRQTDTEKETDKQTSADQSGGCDCYYGCIIALTKSQILRTYILQTMMRSELEENSTQSLARPHEIAPSRPSRPNCQRSFLAGQGPRDRNRASVSSI